MLRTMIAMAAALLIMVPGASALEVGDIFYGPNLVVNGGFDTNLDGWDTAAWVYPDDPWTWDADGNPGGSAHARGRFCKITQLVTIPADGDYLFSFDHYKNNGGAIQWHVEADDFGNFELGSAGMPGWLEWATCSGNATHLGGPWYYGDGQTTALTAGTVFLWIAWTHPASEQAGLVQIDNVSIREVFEATEFDVIMAAIDDNADAIDDLADAIDDNTDAIDDNADAIDAIEDWMTAEPTDAQVIDNTDDIATILNALRQPGASGISGIGKP